MNDPLSREEWQKLASRVTNAQRVSVLTGAGVSKESGIPTFRDAGTGLWSKYRPQDLANPQAFKKNPSLVWEWYNWRRDIVRGVKPNPGHYALAELEKLSKEFVLITQNVDNLHQDAGSQDVIELHGNVMINKCFVCQKEFKDDEIVFDDEGLPHCDCAPESLLRPGVVWFGEMLPEDAIERAFFVSMECDVFFSIGTSSVVYPAAQLPLEAKHRGAYLIEVNPQPTELSRIADIGIQAPSGEALPRLLEEIKLLKEKGD